MFGLCEDLITSIKKSSIWLTKGNMSSKEEGALQDRNIFFDKKTKCSIAMTGVYKSIL